MAILVSLSVCHLLNDMNQSLVPAMYPILKDTYHLDFGQIGLITLAFQLTASMLQPVVGIVTDRRAQPYSLPIAMGCSPQPSPHFDATIAAWKNPVPVTASANVCMSGLSRCSGMLGISS